MQNKKDSSWGSYFKKKVEDINNFIKKVNELGVKPTEIDYKKLNEDVPVENEDLEGNIQYNAQNNVKIRHIRANEESENKNPNENLINLFKLNDADKLFIEKEFELIASSKKFVMYFSHDYRMLQGIIRHINHQAKSDNKDFANDIYSRMIQLTKSFGNIKLLLNHMLFLIEDEKGRLGFPNSNGIQIIELHNYSYIEYMIKNMHSISRTLDISFNIIYQYQKNYQELFQDYLNEDKLNKGLLQPNQVLTEVLSYLKPLSNNRHQELDQFIDKFVFDNNKSKSTSVKLLMTKFDDKESAKACLENMNKNLLSKKFPNFDLYKYIDSSENNIKSLITNFQTMHDKIVGNQKVEANTGVLHHSFLSHYMDLTRTAFSNSYHLKNVKCLEKSIIDSNKNTTISPNRNSTTTSSLATTPTTISPNYNSTTTSSLATTPTTISPNYNSTTTSSLATTPIALTTNATTIAPTINTTTPIALTTNYATIPPHNGLTTPQISLISGIILAVAGTFALGVSLYKYVWNKNHRNTPESEELDNRFSRLSTSTLISSIANTTENVEKWIEKIDEMSNSIEEAKKKEKEEEITNQEFVRLITKATEEESITTTSFMLQN